MLFIYIFIYLLIHSFTYLQLTVLNNGVNSSDYIALSYTLYNE